MEKSPVQSGPIRSFFFLSGNWPQAKLLMSKDPTFLHCRIVSLACSPSGTSFVCSSTVESKSSLTMTSVLKHALDKNTETVGQGTLLLWDLKTMKLEVCLVCLRVRLRSGWGLIREGFEVWLTRMDLLGKGGGCTPTPTTKNWVRGRQNETERWL